MNYPLNVYGCCSLITKYINTIKYNSENLVLCEIHRHKVGNKEFSFMPIYQLLKLYSVESEVLK
jgi:hypothetical protein